MYYFGFFTGGIEGIQDEGTIPSIFEFFSFDANILSIIFGVGDWSGSYESDYVADPGYMKLITSFGFFGLLLFMIVMTFSLLDLKTRFPEYSDLLIFLFIVFAITMIKEPNLLKVQEESFWILLGSLQYIRYHPKLKINSFKNTQ